MAPLTKPARGPCTDIETVHIRHATETIEGWLAVIVMRTGQALHLWRDTMLGLARDGAPDLGPRQMAILLNVYLDPPPHTVRGLAASLGVTKPVITRALDTMGTLGLLARRRDERDRRNVLVQRTVAGAEYLEALGERTARAARSIA